MKKFLALAIVLGASVLFVPSIEAKTGSALALNSANPQINIRIGNQRRNRRTRTETRTRIVRDGRWSYRETIRITYLANGRTRTQVISRTRLRR
jgi:hypothetical protein